MEAGLTQFMRQGRSGNVQESFLSSPGHGGIKTYISSRDTGLREYSPLWNSLPPKVMQARIISVLCFLAGSFQQDFHHDSISGACGVTSLWCQNSNRLGSATHSNVAARDLSHSEGPRREI